MFRPETYELVKEHQVIGVITGHRERFSRVRPGDRVVVYVSQRQELDAYGQITSNPFVATEPIFGPRSARHTQRARIELTRTELKRTAKQLPYGVTALESPSTTPANWFLCSGGFIEITAEDHDWLVGCMEGRIKPKWEDAPG